MSFKKIDYDRIVCDKQVNPLCPHCGEVYFVPEFYFHKYKNKATLIICDNCKIPFVSISSDKMNFTTMPAKNYAIKKFNKSRKRLDSSSYLSDEYFQEEIKIKSLTKLISDLTDFE